MRNLVVGCDGTWNNDLDPSTRTNVFKLLDACASKNQVTFYEEGVGTAHGESLLGGAAGFRIDRQILDSYFFLAREFQHPDWARNQQRIYIYGFSRGAYAARTLAGLIEFAGIPAVPADYKKGWKAFKNQDKDAASKLKGEGRFFDAPIEVLGVWDTVKSTIALPDLRDSYLPGNVVAGYHAMAIDERRKNFPVLKWRANERARQVWFPGVHSDVGGGYKKNGLSSIALKWMVSWSARHKLAFKKSAIEKLKPDPNGELHDSFEGIWKPLGAKTRKIQAHALVHESVVKRHDYAPNNVPPSVEYVKR